MSVAQGNPCRVIMLEAEPETAPPPSDVTHCYTWLSANGVLTYCPTTGHFTWNDVGGHNSRRGKAGCDYTGRTVISISKQSFPATHLAFVWMTGAWPTKPYVHHRDSNPFNNAWNNLYESQSTKRSPSIAVGTPALTLWEDSFGVVVFVGSTSDVPCHNRNIRLIKPWAKYCTLKVIPYDTIADAREAALVLRRTLQPQENNNIRKGWPKPQVFIGVEQTA